MTFYFTFCRRNICCSRIYKGLRSVTLLSTGCWFNLGQNSKFAITYAYFWPSPILRRFSSKKLSVKSTVSVLPWLLRYIWLKALNRITNWFSDQQIETVLNFFSSHFLQDDKERLLVSEADIIVIRKNSKGNKLIKNFAKTIAGILNNVRHNVKVRSYIIVTNSLWA